MEKRHLTQVINRIAVLLLVFSYKFFSAQPPVPGGGGGGAVGPGEPEETPIDMYDGTLMIIAGLLILGYAFYVRKKRLQISK